MTSKDAKIAFERRLLTLGPAMTPQSGIDAMLRFYEEIRAEDCTTDGSDMLLAQWGIYKYLNPDNFTFGIVRQLIPDGGDDDDIWQLELKFRFEPDEELKSAGRANRWCKTRSELAAFDSFLRNLPTLKIIGSRISATELTYQRVG